MMGSHKFSPDNGRCLDWRLSSLTVGMPFLLLTHSTMVPQERLELSRTKHWLLRPACLPFHHRGKCFLSVVVIIAHQFTSGLCTSHQFLHQACPPPTRHRQNSRVANAGWVDQNHPTDRQSVSLVRITLAVISCRFGCGCRNRTYLFPAYETGEFCQNSNPLYWLQRQGSNLRPID